MSHDTAVLLAKTLGLLYLIGFLVIVVILTMRPSRKAASDHAARSILTDEDRPCP
jgi:cytochrome c oxidase cbb3-type subunit IV